MASRTPTSPQLMSGFIKPKTLALIGMDYAKPSNVRGRYASKSVDVEPTDGTLNPVV
jgi:hypothetical protein